MTDDIDPIEEIHTIRKAMYAEAGGTPAGFVRYLRELERKRTRQQTKRMTPSPARKNNKRRKTVAL